ncbi:adenylate cyclase [Syntrophotalea acetylenivorans]|uniref:Adenylate cyclase n=1 Tax=Syntrophotalea acetylenivorans TaxID=1842532 RepID=A0A1L3GLG1_9BACT|nr:CYTH domain-containing protein [Syntrophotalea acetylenivorans]APG26762.1 adenylate cyclase [Syntrophotalea acetylenivorans]
MAIEIERKYLVRSDKWRKEAVGTAYRQGYLTVDPERTVRVRIAGDKGFLTIKGKTEGISRSEFEYSIPLAEATQLLDTLCLRPLIEKVRYKVNYSQHLWEIDVFAGVNEGLVLAEVELESSDDQVELPPWAGKEVTSDPRYYNASLSKFPYQSWDKE